MAGIGRVGVDGSACVVKNICSQDVVAAFRAVSAVVAVDRAAVLRVRNRHDCTGSGGCGGAGNFVIRADLLICIGKCNAILCLCIIRIGHAPVGAHAVLRNGRAATLEGGQHAVRIAERVFAANGIRNFGQIVRAVVGKRCNGDGAAALVLLYDARDLLGGIEDLDLIAVGVPQQGQITACKVHAVAIIVRHAEAAGGIFRGFQAEAVLVLPVVSVLGEVVNCAVAVRVLQIGVGFSGREVVLQSDLFHLLHDIHPDAAAEVHIKPQLAGNVIVLTVGGITGVIIQAQREGIDRRGIGADGLGQCELPGKVGEIGRTGIAEAKRLVGVIRLNAVDIAVRNDEAHAEIGEPCAAFGRGVSVGGHCKAVVRHRAVVPALCGGGDIPENGRINVPVVGVHIVQHLAVAGAGGPGQAAVHGRVGGVCLHIKAELAARAVADAGTEVILVEADIGARQRAALRDGREIRQLEIGFHAAVRRMIAAGNIVLIADRLVRQRGDGIALKFAGAAVVDEGRVDGHGENAVLRLNPGLVGSDGQLPGAGGLFGESIRNGVTFCAGVVKHVGSGEIIDDLLAIQKKNRAVVLQSRRQALQIQIEVKGIAVALPVQDDTFLDVVAENFILEIHIGEHILVQHLGADAGGRRLTGETLLLGFGGGMGRLYGDSLLVRRVGDLRGCDVETFGGDGRLRRKRVAEEHAHSALAGRRGEQEAI